MSYAKSHRLSISKLAIACVVTLAINGSMLLGFDQLAHSTDAVNASGTSQLAKAASAAGRLAL